LDNPNEATPIAEGSGTQTTANVGKPAARPAPSLVKWLPTFYDEFIMAISYESQWISQIFSDPLDVLAALAIEVAQQIRESFETRLASQTLDSLISLYNSTKGTQTTIVALFAVYCMCEKCANVLPYEDFAKALDRHFASHPAALRQRVTGSLVDPYTKFQQKYVSLEKTYTATQFANLKPVRKSKTN
jgi:hypothetical protein